MPQSSRQPGREGGRGWLRLRLHLGFQSWDIRVRSAYPGRHFLTLLLRALYLPRPAALTPVGARGATTLLSPREEVSWGGGVPTWWGI